MLASDRILLANLWGICTSLSRKTATNATVTTIKNSNNEKTIVAVQRKTEELVFGIKNFLKKIAPEDDYLHDTEGPDDMPAHLKCLLTQTNLTMTIKNQKILLGTWQGIFLLEHRYQPKSRELFFHLLGE